MTGNAGGGRLTEPSAPVLALVDEMVALGWPKAWIAREIGTGQGRAMQVGRSGAISVTNARRIRELRQRVGSMTPPRLWRQELPPLEEILADRQPPAAGQRAS
jgi:hypothetical protein